MATHPPEEDEALRVRRVSLYLLSTEAYADQIATQVALLVCPDQSHDGPCPIPHQLITSTLGKKKTRFWQKWFADEA